MITATGMLLDQGTVHGGGDLDLVHRILLHATSITRQRLREQAPARRTARPGAQTRNTLSRDFPRHIGPSNRDLCSMDVSANYQLPGAIDRGDRRAHIVGST